MNIVKQAAEVICNDQISEGVYDMWLKNMMISHAAPGQFVSVYCKDGSRILPRPISICETDRTNKRFRLVYRVLGEGTKELSRVKKGETIEVMGPLGNGFSIDRTGHAILIGGGIGIPPMVELAKTLQCKKTIVLGYRDAVFLKEAFEGLCEIVIATDDGSTGIKGTVIDAIREKNITGDMIYACGPTPMLRGVKALAEQLGIPAQLSLEERMACGIGACLACVCKSKDKDEHTNVNNKRICKEGPVFFADQIEL